jgi:hypothetical protein
LCRRAFAQRRAALDAAEAALHHDETEFQKQVEFFDKRMSDLTLLGAKVQAQSAAVAEQYSRLDAERALVDAAKAEAKAHIESVQRASESAVAKGDKLRQEKSRHEREKSQLMIEQKQFVQEKENALRQIVSGVNSGGYGTTSFMHPPISSIPVGLDATNNNYFTPISPNPPTHIMPTSTLPSYILPGGGITSPQRIPPATGDLSAALASLSSHASELRGFMTDEKMLDS